MNKKNIFRLWLLACIVNVLFLVLCGWMGTMYSKYEDIWYALAFIPTPIGLGTTLMACISWSDYKDKW